MCEKCCMTWRIHVCGVTHSRVWYDSFICVTWLIHIRDMPHSRVWHAAFTRVTWLTHMCDITPLIMDMLDMTHLHVWYDSFKRVTWLIHTRDMTHAQMWHASFIEWCYFYYFVRNSLVALLEALCAHRCDMPHSRAHRAWSKTTRLFLTK